MTTQLLIDVLLAVGLICTGTACVLLAIMQIRLRRDVDRLTRQSRR